VGPKSVPIAGARSLDETQTSAGVVDTDVGTA
jgi:hypothetical protein